MKNKRLIALFMAMIIILSGAVNVYAVKFEEKLSALVEMKLVSGMGEKNGVVDYALDDAVTREQMATLVCNALKLKVSAKSSDFTDVKADRWSVGYITAAKNAGIISGVGNGKFAPADDVKLQDVLVMVLKAKYADETKSLKYPEGYVELAKAKHLLDGVESAKFAKTADRKTVFNVVYNTFVAGGAKVEPEQSAKMREFKDSLGRVHNLPTDLERVSPNGNMATLVLYAVAPDKMVSVGKKFKGVAADYIKADVKKLPETGVMFGSSGTLNKEEIIKINPQILIDVGQTDKKDMAKTMDETQKIIGIPYIMVEGMIDTWATTFRTLGDVLNAKAQGEALAKYAESTASFAKANKAKIEAMNLSVYWARGKAGEETVPAGSIHSQIIEYVGLKNIAKNLTIQKGSQTAAYSPEELIKNAPDIIIADNAQIKKAIMENKLYENIPAVKNDRIYIIPSEPYSFMTAPPAFNQLLGVKWLGNVAAPEVYKVDMVKEIQEFYKLFYHFEISAQDAAKLLNK